MARTLVAPGEERRIRSARRHLLDTYVGAEVAQKISLGIGQRDKAGAITSIDLGAMACRAVEGDASFSRDLYAFFKSRDGLPTNLGIWPRSSYAWTLRRALGHIYGGLLAMSTVAKTDDGKLTFPQFISKPKPEVFEHVNPDDDYYFNTRRRKASPTKAVETLLHNNKELLITEITKALGEETVHIGMHPPQPPGTRELVARRLAEGMHEYIAARLPKHFAAAIGNLVAAFSLMEKGFHVAVSENLEKTYQAAKQEGGISSCMATSPINTYYRSFKAKALLIRSHQDGEILGRAIFWPSESFVNKDIPKNLCVIDRVYWSGALANTFKLAVGRTSTDFVSLAYQTLSLSLVKAGYLPVFASVDISGATNVTVVNNFTVNGAPLIMRGVLDFAGDRSILIPSIDNARNYIAINELPKDQLEVYATFARVRDELVRTVCNGSGPSQLPTFTRVTKNYWMEYANKPHPYHFKPLTHPSRMEGIRKMLEQ